MRLRPLSTRTQAALTCVFAGLTVLTCIGLFTAAALVPAPAAVVPLVVTVCIAGPMVAAWELRGAIAVLRRGETTTVPAPPLDSHAVAALRRHLKQLPETQHPLGL
jgi:hypothetical protein